MRKFLFGIALRWYCFWSNRVMWVERTFLKCKKVPKFPQNYNHIEAWKNFTKPLTHYGSDPWWKGFDAISAPERFLVTKADDCDTFAMLGRSYFGHDLLTDKDDYYFDGLHCLNFWKEGGHVLAVWKATTRKHYFVVDNDTAYFTSNPYTNWKTKNGVDLKLVGIINLDIHDELYFVEILEN